MSLLSLILQCFVVWLFKSLTFYVYLKLISSRAACEIVYCMISVIRNLELFISGLNIGKHISLVVSLLLIWF